MVIHLALEQKDCTRCKRANTTLNSIVEPLNVVPHMLQGPEESIVDVGKGV
jgi:hypothetical protein